MKTVILFNNSDKDILNYRIEEARVDADGNVMYDPTGEYLKTDRTFEWTIKAGEKLEFPEYVAKYLKSVYGFLQVESEPVNTLEVDVQSTNRATDEDKEEGNTPVAQAQDGSVRCRHCGETFKNMKGLALHISFKHPEKL